MSKFDDSGFDAIDIDEVYVASIRLLAVLAEIQCYSENNPNKIIFETGDSNQLDTVDIISNQFDNETYMGHCVKPSFPTT